MSTDDIVVLVCDKLAEHTVNISKDAYQEVLKDLIDEFKVRLKVSQEDA